MMLVLASNSPRRRQLIALGGWEFTVFPAQVDESVYPLEEPGDYVRRLALSKAKSVSASLGGSISSETIIVAADTAVVNPLDAEAALDGFEILGKPADARQAAQMLKSLRGRIHQVYTALVVFRLDDGVLLDDLCITDVPMRDYSDEEMIVYIESGDPFDKAGAYAIQHSGFRPVQNLHGCYANVMGLPLCHLTRLLERLGVPATRNVPRSCQENLDYSCPVFQHILGVRQMFAS
jgi:MAF protein